MKNDLIKMFLKNFEQRLSKLKKGYSQDLVKQTVIRFLISLEFIVFSALQITEGQINIRSLIETAKIIKDLVIGHRVRVITGV